MEARLDGHRDLLRIQRRRAAVCFHHQEGAYDTGTLIGALEELRGFLGGQQATLVGRAARPP